MAEAFHRRFLRLVEELERNFQVARWKSGDLDLWPLARMDLYLDMFWANAGASAPKLPPRTLRVLTYAAAPLSNLWKIRHDRAHWVSRPNPAHAILLGDGVSLDRVNGEWQDRFGEPVIAALEKRKLRTFLMQSGDLSRLPWHRPTFAANVIAVYATFAGFGVTTPAELPDHDRVLQFLARNGINAPSLSAARLRRRARVGLAAAAGFERVLRIVKPTLAFVVTYYAGLGHAFMLACRRQGVLSVDLQHCPQAGAHKAYGWTAPPDKGYATLPALFWTWTEEDAADIRRWTNTLAVPWHRSLNGGHTQLVPYMDESDPRTRLWDEKFHAIGKGGSFEREILVALQPLSGQRAQWDALTAQIEAAPPAWRWWIRRHPAARSYQDDEYLQLLRLRLPNVIVEEASSLPLPALLRHMSVLLSLCSGASAEGAAFGVPVLFLSEVAQEMFPGLIERGFATVVDVQKLNAEIARLPALPVRPKQIRQPNLDETLRHLEDIARDYSQLCASKGSAR